MGEARGTPCVTWAYRLVVTNAATSIGPGREPVPHIGKTEGADRVVELLCLIALPLETVEGGGRWRDERDSKNRSVRSKDTVGVQEIPPGLANIGRDCDSYYCSSHRAVGQMRWSREMSTKFDVLLTVHWIMYVLLRGRMALNVEMATPGSSCIYTK